MDHRNGPGGEAAERQIQKRILQLLQQIGPTNYNLLFLQFDFHDGYLEGAVEKLLDGNLIEVDSGKMVHITVAGHLPPR